MANYLVTGAAGFIGAALAKALIDDGHTVVTIDNLSTGYESNIPKGATFIRGDCGEPSVYEQIPQERYDAIFHIAGQSSGEISFDDPIYDIRTNAESTLLLLKFALKNGCGRFVFAGTMSVYGIKSDKPVSEKEECFPQSFYGVGKLASEHYMRIYQSYGINSTCLRLFNVYGPGQNMKNLRQGMVSIFLAQMQKTDHIHIKGSSDRYRDFVYITDVVDVFIACLNCSASSNEVVNVGSGVKTTVGELISKLINVSGREVSVKFAGTTPGDIHGIFSDTSKLVEIFGKLEFVTLDEGLRMLVKEGDML